jgi:hypothetical protein
MEPKQGAFEGFASVEIMGHQRHIGMALPAASEDSTPDSDDDEYEDDEERDGPF